MAPGRDSRRMALIDPDERRLATRRRIWARVAKYVYGGVIVFAAMFAATTMFLEGHHAAAAGLAASMIATIAVVEWSK